MASIFTKIVQGEIPSYKVAEDDNYFAFLDINPLTEGHTLVIPKKEIDNVFDLDDQTYNGLFSFTKKVSLALKQSVECIRIGVMIYGLDVPHAHIHLIPVKGIGNELNFSNPRVKLTKEDFMNIADRISLEFKKLTD